MKVYLSKQAEYKLDLILAYLLEKWNFQIKENFIETLKSKFKQISTFPESCPKSERQNELYRCVLTKQVTFFYRIKLDKEIEIITFFDTRQNPKKVNKEL